MSYFLFKQTKSWSSRDTELEVFLLIYQKKRLTDLKCMIAERRQTVCSFTNLQTVYLMQQNVAELLFVIFLQLTQFFISANGLII